MNVKSFKSGSLGILKILTFWNVKNVVAPQNLCPSVIKLISDNFNVILAEIYDHTKPANYHLINLSRKETAILFVHPYGIFSLSERKNISKYYDYIIDDICLCDINDFLKLYNQHYSYVLSFNYSKYIEFDNGALTFTPYKLDNEPFPIKIPDNYYGISLSIKSYCLDHHISSFLESDFYNLLKFCCSIREEHKNSILKIYKDYLYNFSYFDSPFRFNILLNNNQFVLINDYFNSINDNQLFIGNNYPLYRIENNKLLKVNPDRVLRVINLFHDHRVTIKTAIRLSEVVRSILL